MAFLVSIGLTHLGQVLMGKYSQVSALSVHTDFFDHIWLECVVYYQLHAAVGRSLRRVMRIYLLISVFVVLRSILYDEVESLIKREKLKRKFPIT